MKLLLDEQVPRQLAGYFPKSYEVKTVQQMGWGGTTNGALFSLAATEGFAALLTADKNIEYQQNLSTLPVMVLVLMAHGNRIQDLEPFVPSVIRSLEQNTKPDIYRITIQG